jgi:hypothetical protein
MPNHKIIIPKSIMARVLLGIEFDQAAFAHPVKAEQWLRERPEYESLVKRQRWRLTNVARSKWMSKEGRKVFSWYSENLWRFSTLEITRPDPYIMVVWGLAATFDDTDIPALYPHTVQKEAALLLTQKLKDEKKMERTNEAKLRKRKKKETNKKTVVKVEPVTDASALLEKPLLVVEKEQPKKTRGRKKKKVDEFEATGIILDGQTFADRLDSV